MVYIKYINLQRKTDTKGTRIIRFVLSLWKRNIPGQAATRNDAICMYNPTKMIYVCKSVSLLKNIIN